MPPRRPSPPPPPPHAPPHHGPPHHGPPHHGAPPPPHALPFHHAPPSRRSSGGLSSLAGTAGVAELLAPFIADEEDREFVARCIATEGPPHHRVASFALLRLMSEALAAAGGPLPAPQGGDDDFPVPFRLPPHLDRQADADAHYPIRLPRRALERLVAQGSRDAGTIADALTDGPAHHALANVVMVNMLHALLERLSKKGGE